ncbi:hypothetical protein D3C87_1337820 [compost metagenome]
MAVAANGEDETAYRLAAQHEPQRQRDDDGGCCEPRNRTDKQGRTEGFDRFRNAIERLRPGDAEVDTLVDRQRGQRDDESGNAGDGNQQTVEHAADNTDQYRSNGGHRCRKPPDLHQSRKGDCRQSADCAHGQVHLANGNDDHLGKGDERVDRDCKKQNLDVEGREEVGAEAADKRDCQHRDQ